MGSASLKSCPLPPPPANWPPWSEPMRQPDQRDRPVFEGPAASPAACRPSARRGAPFYGGLNGVLRDRRRIRLLARGAPPGARQCQPRPQGHKEHRRGGCRRRGRRPRSPRGDTTDFRTILPENALYVARRWAAPGPQGLLGTVSGRCSARLPEERRADVPSSAPSPQRSLHLSLRRHRDLCAGGA